MKKLFLSVALMVITIGATAQSGVVAEVGKEFTLAEFLINPGRMDAGLTLVQVGSFSDYARFGMGASLLYNGFYLDFLEAEPQHKYTGDISDTQWNDTCVFSINVGYQIPILSWLRIMPLIGYAQTNDGITDGSSLSMSTDSDSISWYHNYKVTSGSRTHYFNYGGGISVQPCRWFSINLIGTRCALYGGIGLNLLEFARR